MARGLLLTLFPDETAAEILQVLEQRQHILRWNLPQHFLGLRVDNFDHRMPAPLVHTEVEFPADVLHQLIELVHH